MKSLLTLNDLPVDQTQEFELDESHHWVADLLAELQEELSTDELVQGKIESRIKMNLKLTRRKNAQYGDYILVNGYISAVFGSLCVRTGHPMQDELEFEINAVCINSDLEQSFQLEEETTLYIEDDERELFYLANKKLDIADLVHELVFLNKNPYPKIEGSVLSPSPHGQ